MEKRYYCCLLLPTILNAGGWRSAPSRGNDFQLGRHFILLQKSVSEALVSIHLWLCDDCRALLDQPGVSVAPLTSPPTSRCWENTLLVSRFFVMNEHPRAADYEPASAEKYHGISLRGDLVPSSMGHSNFGSCIWLIVCLDYLSCCGQAVPPLALKWGRLFLPLWAIQTEVCVGRREVSFRESKSPRGKQLE